MSPLCPYCDKPLDNSTLTVGLDWLFCHTCKKAWTMSEWVEREPYKNKDKPLGLISEAELMEMIRFVQSKIELEAAIGTKE
ncbi:MAG TPA: hypothetical protein DCS07_10555 [Bdellovibrionales bacterium]|nr:hypothetical protein [Bdellovibrionales bacterium]